MKPVQNGHIVFIKRHQTLNFGKRWVVYSRTQAESKVFVTRCRKIWGEIWCNCEFVSETNDRQQHPSKTLSFDFLLLTRVKLFQSGHDKQKLEFFIFLSETTTSFFFLLLCNNYRIAIAMKTQLTPEAEEEKWGQ